MQTAPTAISTAPARRTAAMPPGSRAVSNAARASWGLRSFATPAITSSAATTTSAGDKLIGSLGDGLHDDGQSRRVGRATIVRGGQGHRVRAGLRVLMLRSAPNGRIARVQDVGGATCGIAEVPMPMGDRAERVGRLIDECDRRAGN